MWNRTPVSSYALTIAFVMHRVGYEISLQYICLEFLVLFSRNRNVSVLTTLLPTFSPADSTHRHRRMYRTTYDRDEPFYSLLTQASDLCCQLSCHSSIHLTIIYKYVAVKIFLQPWKPTIIARRPVSRTINIFGVASVDTNLCSDRPS